MKRVEYREYIGSLIEYWRSLKGFSVARLAAEVGIEPNNLKRLILGKYSVGIDILGRIANVLGVYITFVPYGDNEIQIDYNRSEAEINNLDAIVPDGTEANS